MTTSIAWGAQHFIDMAQDGVRVDDQTGTRWLLVGSRALAEGSATSFVARDMPFGNDIWPHHVAGAEDLAEEMHRQGIRGTDGSPVVVLLRAAPCAKSTYGLLSEKLQRVADGDATPIAEVENEVAVRAGLTELVGDVSFSQPAAHAAPRMIDALDHFDVSGGVLIGEPPHAESTTRGKLLVSFAREGARFQKTVKAEGMDIMKDVLHSPGFASGIWAQRAENGPIIEGFTRGGLAGDLVVLSEAGIPATVLHASDSYITRRQAAIRAVEGANAVILKARGDHDSRGTWPLTRRVEILRANHALADRWGRFNAAAVGIIAANCISLSQLRLMAPSATV